MSRIAVSQFAILKEILPEGTISLTTELSFKYSADTRQVACEVGYDFHTEKGTFLVLKCQCMFAVHPDDWSGFIVDGGIGIPKSVLEMFAVHTIGTSRGILFCKTEGTPFNGLMIPPLNVAAMMEDESKIVAATM